MNKLEEKFELKTYQCNEFGFIKLRTLFDYFQELASDHADKLGLGYEACLEKNCAWVCAKYHVVINTLPKFKDIISVQTWPSKFSGPTGIREFLVKDSDENILIKAVSQWVMIDLNRLRPTIVQNMFDCSKIEFGEDQNIVLEKLPLQTENKIITQQTLRYDDVDVNHHINNAVYIALAEDSLFDSKKENIKISELSVDFKKSALLSDKIVNIKANIETNHADFTISSQDNITDFARINIKF